MKRQLGRQLFDKKDVALFQNVAYIMDDTLDTEQVQQLSRSLINHGGTPAGQHNASNLFISNTKEHPSIASVTPLWVEKAIANGFVHDIMYYKPGKNQFLSGQVLLLLDLPSDNEAILQTLAEYGGQYRDDYENDITCLVCIDPRGPLYRKCIERHTPAVLPQWLDDCFRYHCKLPYDRYRFPTPSVYYQNKEHEATLHPYPKDIESLEFLSNSTSNEKPFQDEVIYFGKDVRLDERKIPILPIVQQHIERNGGQVVHEYDRHLVTVVVLKFRSSLEYIQALEDEKCVASFWWITNTIARGYICSPLDTLLDYPVPKVGIPEMKDCVITVTGFKGAFRTFISSLIIASGAMFSAELEKDTTHMICGGGYGKKYLHLSEYPHVVRVNHLWLEDCYAQWRKIDTASDRRYTYIPQNNALLADTVAKTTLIRSVVDKWGQDTDDAEPTVVYENIDGKNNGFVTELKPRKAALRAMSVLNDIIIPDVNAYEKEIKSKR